MNDGDPPSSRPSSREHEAAATGTGSRRGAEDKAAATGAAAFRHRDFRLYFVGKALATLSLQMIMVAIGYQIYDITGNAMDLGYIGLATFTPAVGFCLVTGYVSDRYDRRRVLAVCYLAMAVAATGFLLFTLARPAAVWPVFLILMLLGTGRAFYQPASTALVPNLVPVEQFPNAVAWNTSATKISQVVGPAVGGLLYIAGPAMVYGAAAIVLALGFATTLLIRVRPQSKGRQPLSLTSLLAGIRYVLEKKVLFGAITLDLFVVLLGGVTALLPIYAKDILQVGPSGAGFLRSAVAAGAVMSALALTQVPLTRAVGRILYCCVFIYGVATLVFGVSTAFWLSMAAMAVLGAADMISVNIRSTLLQIATPDEMRGRVSAVNSIFTGASNEIGEFRAGTMAALIGAVPAVVVGGIGSMIVATACWKLFPALTRVERMDRNMYGDEETQAAA